MDRGLLHPPCVPCSPGDEVYTFPGVRTQGHYHGKKVSVHSAVTTQTMPDPPPPPHPLLTMSHLPHSLWCVCVCVRERERDRQTDRQRQTDQDGDKKRRKTTQYNMRSAVLREVNSYTHTHACLHTCMLAHMQDHTLFSFPKVCHIINFKKVVSVEMIVLCAVENMRNHSIVTHFSSTLPPHPPPPLSLFPSFYLFVSIFVSLCLKRLMLELCL